MSLFLDILFEYPPVWKSPFWKIGHHLLYFITNLFWLTLENHSAIHSVSPHLCKRQEGFYCSHKMPGKGKWVMIFHDLIPAVKECSAFWGLLENHAKRASIFHCPGVCETQLNIWVAIPYQQYLFTHFSSLFTYIHMYVVEFSNMHRKMKKSDLAFLVKGFMVERCASFLCLLLMVHPALLCRFPERQCNEVIGQTWVWMACQAS